MYRDQPRWRRGLVVLEERNGGRRALAALALILAVGLALRIGYAIDGGYQPPDSRAYAQIAENLYEDGAFEVRRDGQVKEIQPSSTYAPGIPYFVAGVYAVTGGVDVTVARVVLAFLGAATLLLAYLLGRRLGGPMAGLIAAGVLCIYPALVEYHGLLLTEPLASFLLAAGLLAGFRAWDGDSLGAWAGTGALFGALCLVRPEYLAIAALVPVVALLARAKRPELRRRLLAAGVTLLAAALVVVPWAVRNAVVLDRVVLVSTGGGKAFYVGTHLAADGNGVKLRELLLDSEPRYRDRLARAGPLDDPNRLILERALTRVGEREYPGVEIDVALGRLASTNLANSLTDHPADFAWMLAGKAFDTWTIPARETMRQPWFRALQIGLLVAAIGGFVLIASRQPFEALVLGFILAYITAIGALLIASPRRALVLLPLVAALASVGLLWAVRRLPAARWRLPRRRARPARVQPTSQHT